MKHKKTDLPPGIERLEDGRYKIDTTATCLRTKKRKRRRQVLPAGTTLQEAIETRDHLKDKIRGVPLEKPSRQTFAGYAADWIERRQRWLSPSTAATYRRIIDKQLVPFLGTLYADSIVRADLEDWVTWAQDQRTNQKQPYSQDTLGKWWRVLVTLSKDLAADLGLDDPTARVRAPTSSVRGVRSTKTLNTAELGRLLEYARDDEELCARWPEMVVLAYTGMRSGELWALRWEDLEDDTLHVRRTVSQGQIRDTTKTGFEREVYAPGVVIDALAWHRERMIRRQHRGLASGLIFPSDEGTPRRPGCLRKALEQAATGAQLSKHVTPQVLRRTFNTLAIAAGIDRIVLRSQMGHCDEEMTERYAGVGMDLKRAAVVQIFPGVTHGV